MKEFFSNIWVKRSVSVFCIVYAAVIALLAYATFLYNLEFAEGMETPFFIIYTLASDRTVCHAGTYHDNQVCLIHCTVGTRFPVISDHFIIYTLASAIFLALMLITRKQRVTCIIGMIFPFIVFLLILFNIGSWVLIIPPFIVAVVMFFAADNHETTKVVAGTIYLLVYVLGIVLYIVLNMLFGGSSVETVLNEDLDPSTSVYRIYQGSFDKLKNVTSDENTISPDGKYQFYLVDVRDSDRGAVKIRKTISNKGTRGVIPDVGWTVKTNDSGEQILYVQYRLTDQDKLRETSVTRMPGKQYLEFLGIS